MNATLKKLSRFPALAILIFGAGCGDRDEQAGGAGSDGPPEPGGTVVIVEGADMVIPVGILAMSALDGALGADVMFMELLRPDWEDGELIFKNASESPMAIAHGYEFVGPDSTALRFRMRSDIRWSDGQPLTARDVVFTFDILDEPVLASPQQSYAAFVEEVVAENDSTVVFRFSRRHPEMVTNVASVPIIAEHAFGETPLAEFRNDPKLRNPENGNLPVSGPYMVGSWVRGQRITLVRNPQFQPAGYLDQIIFRIVPDPTTRIVELQTGAADFAPAITLDQLPGLRAQAPHIRFEREEKRVYDYIAYNTESFAPFADIEIKRALGLALDLPGIISALEMDDWAIPAGGPYPPIFKDLYDPQGQAPLPHDPAAARQILESKGWRDSNNDGILDRNGQPFRFTLVTNVGNQRRIDAAQIVQQQWRQIGVDAQLQTIEFNTLQEKMLGGDFQAVLSGWQVGLSPSLADTWSVESPFNFIHYENPEVTRLMEQALTAPSYDGAVTLWKEVASRIVQDRPYTWLYFLDMVDGVNNRVHGTIIDTFGSYQNMWEWWIPASERRPGETLAQ